MKHSGWITRYKKLFKTRLLIAGFVLALVGWFILWVEFFGKYYEDELLELEKIVQTSTFTWSLRVAVLAMLLLLVLNNKWLAALWQKKPFRYTILLIYAVGLTGWLTWLIGFII